MTAPINCPKCNLDLKAELASAKNDNEPIVVDVEFGQWDEIALRSDGLVVVEFWHQGCPACKKFAPVFSKVAADFEGIIRFLKVDVLKNKKNMALAVKYEVTSTPTLVFLCKGKVVSLNEEWDGFENEEQFKKTINKLLDGCST
jgi:thiol-disulfide isomerase/thioredoxin